MFGVKSTAQRFLSSMQSKYQVISWKLYQFQLRPENNSSFTDNLTDECQDLVPSSFHLYGSSGKHATLILCLILSFNLGEKYSKIDY